MAKSILRYFAASGEQNELFDLVGDAVTDGTFGPATRTKVVLEGPEGGRIVFKGDFTVINGEVMGGTITKFTAFLNGGKVLKGTKYALPFADLASALEDGSDQVFYMLLTSDRTVGSKGNDLIFGISKLIEGGKGNNRIFSSFGDKTVDGGAGNDTIIAGTGRDHLHGGRGRDDFGFVSPLDGVDKIHDFSVRRDRIGLDEGGFDQLADAVDGAEFHIGREATTAEQRLLYDDGNGKLYWDGDGLGGSGKLLIARLPDGLKLTAANFYVDDFT